MRYYKRVSNGYIVSVGTGFGGTEITEAEYSNIIAIISTRPEADGNGYRLREDLTWEAYDLPVEDAPLSAEDEIEIYKAALNELGVETEDDNAE